MPKKKPRKDPLQLPVKELFGKSLAAISAGMDADHDSHVAAVVAEEKAIIERVLAHLRANNWPINKLSPPGRKPRNIGQAVKASRAAIRAERPPAREIEDAMKEWWPIRLLREASRDPDAYKRRLYYLLFRLEIIPPDGVLAPWPGTLGAPKNIKAEITRARYKEIGEPKPVDWKVCDALAAFTYPDEFKKTTSSSKLRKRLRDRVGRQVRLDISARAPTSAT